MRRSGVGRTLLFVVALVIAGRSGAPGTSVDESAVPSTPTPEPDGDTLPVYIGVVLGLPLAVGLPFVIVSWIDETLAELFAILNIGVDNYRSIREETRSKSDASLLRTVRIRIQYPPDSIIL